MERPRNAEPQENLESLLNWYAVRVIVAGDIAWKLSRTEPEGGVSRTLENQFAFLRDDWDRFEEAVRALPSCDSCGKAVAS